MHSMTIRSTRARVLRRIGWIRPNRTSPRLCWPDNEYRHLGRFRTPTQRRDCLHSTKMRNYLDAEHRDDADTRESRARRWQPRDCGFRDRKAIAAKQASMTRRRCLKSHTPMDGISYGSEPTYIVVYRHPVDAHFSFRSHVENMKDPGPLTEMFPEDIQDTTNLTHLNNYWCPRIK